MKQRVVVKITEMFDDDEPFETEENVRNYYGADENATVEVLSFEDIIVKENEHD